MSKRSQQREETRERIVGAAAGAFAEFGYGGASTREIAKRADTNQGLITYHFRSKDELWRAAADRLLGALSRRLRTHMSAFEGSPKERARELVREYVRFAAANPDLFRLMVEAGKRDDERMKWLVETHVKPAWEEGFASAEAPLAGLVEPELLPHFYYVMVGAGSVMFALEPECRRLTGLDPTSEDAIARHADFVAGLLVP